MQEVIVTAEKREENVQKTPLSIQVLGTQKLDQLQVQNFNGLRQVPAQRLLSDRGPRLRQRLFPRRGQRREQQPLRPAAQRRHLSGRAADHHHRRLAGHPQLRRRAGRGPGRAQGTLYGASSQSGTLRIITNQPQIGVFSGAYNLEVNDVDHGGVGYIGEGYANLPVNDKMAIRLVGWYEHDAGYIDNVMGTDAAAGIVDGVRTYPTASALAGMPITHSAAPYVKDDYNDANTLWRPRGPEDRPQRQLDHHPLADRPVDQQQRQLRLRSRRRRSEGRPLPAGVEPRQVVSGGADHPGQDRQLRRDLCRRLHGPAHRLARRLLGLLVLLRFPVRLDRLRRQRRHHRPVAGHLGQGQLHQAEPRACASPRRPTSGCGSWAGCSTSARPHFIEQRYVIDGLSPDLSVPGWPDTIWLTEQMRDRPRLRDFRGAVVRHHAQADRHRRHPRLYRRQRPARLRGPGLLRQPDAAARQQPSALPAVRLGRVGAVHQCAFERLRDRRDPQGQRHLSHRRQTSWSTSPGPRLPARRRQPQPDPAGVQPRRPDQLRGRVEDRLARPAACCSTEPCSWRTGTASSSRPFRPAPTA
ncbi:MAG: hypothetical protein WDM92_08425 [Caulobacteraceae bacterium]